MKSPYKPTGQTPLLSPLARQTGWRPKMRQTLENLPPAAAPIAFTLAGGVALVAVVASVLAGAPAREASLAAAAKLPEATDAAPETIASLKIRNTAAEPTPGQAKDSDIDAARPAQPASATKGATPPAGMSSQISGSDLAAVKVPADGLPAELTASIPPAKPGGTFVPVVPIAETPEEIEALEAIQRQEVQEDIGAPSEEETAAVPPAALAMVPATTKEWVNMRSGPNDESEVLQVVPALASVKAEADCGWCAVSYEGRQGYIYKSFLSYEDASGQ